MPDLLVNTRPLTPPSIGSGEKHANEQPLLAQYCSFKLQILPRDLLVTMATDVIAWPFAKVHLVAQRTRRA
jgi:hypothetical protein